MNVLAFGTFFVHSWCFLYSYGQLMWSPSMPRLMLFIHTKQNELNSGCLFLVSRKFVFPQVIWQQFNVRNSMSKVSQILINDKRELLNFKLSFSDWVFKDFQGPVFAPANFNYFQGLEKGLLKFKSFQDACEPWENMIPQSAVLVPYWQDLWQYWYKTLFFHIK